MAEINVEQIVREYIEKTVHLSLATVNGDTPWVCEVHFAYDNTLSLYFRSLTSRRHSQEIAANPKVAGNIIDTYKVGEPVVGVYFEGEAALLEAGEEQNLAAECVKNRLQTSNDILQEATHPDGHQFYKIAVKNWYVFGNFDGTSTQKYQLEWNADKERQG